MTKDTVKNNLFRRLQKKSSKQKKGNFFTKGGWILLWFYTAGVLLWYSLRIYPGDRLLPVLMINYIVPWLLVILVPGMLIAWRYKHRYLALILTTLTLFIGKPYIRLFMPTFDSCSQTTPLKVMSYSAMGRNKNYEAIAKVIKQVRPDLLFLQETGHAVIEKLTDLYPSGQLHYYIGNVGVIVSRFDIIPIDSKKIQKAVIKTPGKNITVWNIHADKIFTGKNFNNVSRQLNQFSLLADEIRKADGPVIVAGDFNTTENTQAYRTINRYLKNAHWEAGWGFGFTFPTRARRIGSFMPFIRIDHIFYSDHFCCIKAKVLSQSGGSDHLPMVADFQY